MRVREDNRLIYSFYLSASSYSLNQSRRDAINIEKKQAEIKPRRGDIIQSNQKDIPVYAQSEIDLEIRCILL